MVLWGTWFSKTLAGENSVFNITLRGGSLTTDVNVTLTPENGYSVFYDFCCKFLFVVAVVHLFWMHNYRCLVPLCTDWTFPFVHLKRPPVPLIWVD